jgi:hypothetical protein
MEIVPASLLRSKKKQTTSGSSRISIVVIIIRAVPVTLQPSGSSLIPGMHIPGMHLLSLLPPNLTILASLVLLGEGGTAGAGAE